MKKVEKLYEVMGELLYAVAMADGVIQPEEKEALKKLLRNHMSEEDILWSFEYEESKNSSVEEIYNKVINFCHNYGPAPQYNEFINRITSYNVCYTKLLRRRINRSDRPVDNLRAEA